MIKKGKTSSSGPAPRRKAQKKTTSQPDNARQLPALEVQRLIADLETHQFELDAQNEELRQAQHALSESETKYRIVADNTSNWEFWIGPDGRFLYSSPSCLRITGRKPEAFLKDPSLFFRIIHPDDAVRVKEHVQESNAARSACEMEYRIIRPDGTACWISHSCKPVFDEAGTFLGTRGSNRDITDQKGAERALRESEAWYRVLFERAGDAIFILEAEGEKKGRIVDANHAAAEMHGYTVEELLHLTIMDLDTPETLRDVPEMIRRIRRGEWLKREVGHRRKDGSVFPCEINAGLIEAAGRTFILAFDRDITERKQAEAALRESEERYRSLVELSPDSIALHCEGKIVYVNRAALALCRAADAGDLVGRNVLDFVHVRDREVIEDRMQKSYEQKVRAPLRETKLLRLDGEAIDVETTSAPATYRGKPATQVVIRDITERKRAEEALRTAHAELQRRTYEYEAINRELEAFSYTVSHDLKAPLRSIEGFTRAILEDYADKLDSTGKDYLMRVRSGTQRMNQLIEAMLKMARLTHGEIHENSVDLSSLAKVIAHELKTKEPQRRVEFVIAEKIRVNGDAEMLRVMLQNLLENAWKFTNRHETATIEFGVIDMEGRTVCFVRDDGAGFDMEFAGKLFMPFKRLHAESDFPGLGIGLAIANHIVTRHNGRMWARSAPEKGATFYFTL